MKVDTEFSRSIIASTYGCIDRADRDECGSGLTDGVVSPLGGGVEVNRRLRKESR